MAILPVSGIAEIILFQRPVADGFGGGVGAVQAVVLTADPLVGVAVQGHAQDELFRRDALVQIGLYAVRDAALPLGRGAGGRVQRGVEVGRDVPGTVEVIAHQEDVVHDVRHFDCFDLVQIPAAGGAGDGEGIVLPVPAALAVQLGPQLLQQLGEVLLVRRAVDGPRRAAGHRVFPVQVYPVQALRHHEVHAAGGECLPPGRRGGGVGEILGVRPAAHGDQQLQMLILLPQLPEGSQVLLIVGRVLQGDGQGVRVDPGKGVVDLGQVLCRKLVRRVALVGRPPGVIAHHFAAGLVCTLLCSGGGAQQQCRHTRGGQRGGGASDKILQGKTLLFQMIVTAWRVSSRSILPDRAAGLKAQMLAARPENSSAAGPFGSAAPAFPVID